MLGLNIYPSFFKLQHSYQFLTIFYFPAKFELSLKKLKRWTIVFFFENYWAMFQAKFLSNIQSFIGFIWMMNPNLHHISNYFKFNHIKPYHIESYHLLSDHSISYQIMWNRIISYWYHVLSYHITSYQIKPYHKKSNHIISYQITPYQIISNYKIL